MSGIDFSIVFQNLFTWDVLLALVIGVTTGIIFGAIPGLNANLATSLLLPISFGMKPVPGLVMLTAVYTSTVYGGSITAILIHTPGTGSSAATAIDGFELTKQGRGLTAVGMATISSAFGGMLSAIALFSLAQPLASLSLKFGPLEYFALGILGLTVVSALAGKDPLKGLIAVCFGCLIGTVGVDPIKGVQRFTFGLFDLQNGLSNVAVLMGVFSISQVLIGIESIAKGEETIVRDPDEYMKGNRLPSHREFVECLPATIRSSIMGILIGIVPAAGAMISSWICYGQGKKWSKHPEMFGKGAMEGVVCSETGNNAATGGALIPMMALGIPGSSVAGIILGGFVMHGLTPGFALFRTSGNLCYSIIVGFFFANLLMGIFGLLFSIPVAKIAVVPMKILYPLVLAVASMGCFSINGRMVDVFVMTIFGFIGYILRKNKFDLSPLVLGLILGDIIEINLNNAIILSKGNFMGYVFSRPIALVLFVISAVSVIAPFVSPLIKKLFKRSKPVSASAADVKETVGEQDDI